MAGLKGVTVLVEDIVVHAPTEEDHNRRFMEVFRRLTQHRLTINSEVDFLGYSTSAEEVRPLRSPVEVIQSIPPAVTSSALASLLAMTNYYLPFVEGYASITNGTFIYMGDDLRYVPIVRTKKTKLLIFGLKILFCNLPQYIN